MWPHTRKQHVATLYFCYTLQKRLHTEIYTYSEGAPYHQRTRLDMICVSKIVYHIHLVCVLCKIFFCNKWLAG